MDVVIGVGALALLLAIVLILRAVSLARRATTVPAVIAGAGVGSLPAGVERITATTPTVRPAVVDHAPTAVATDPIVADGPPERHALDDGEQILEELGHPVTPGVPGWRHDPDGRPDIIRYFDGATWTAFYGRKIGQSELPAAA